MSKKNKIDNDNEIMENQISMFNDNKNKKNIVEIEMPTENIIFSKEFKNKYQLDFMRAILYKDKYTVSEAKKILLEYFKF